MRKKKRMTDRFAKLLVSVSLLIAAIYFIDSCYGNKHHNLNPPEHKELADYYMHMQSGLDFTKSRLLNPKADYLQPWMTSNWKYEDYKSYLEKIKAAGMEYVVLQYVASAEVVKGKAKLTENYFHLDDDDENPYLPVVYSKCTGHTFVSHFDVVDNLLLAAKDVGIKVYLGTLWSEQWWNDDFTKAKWRAEIIALEKIIISYFIARYKHAHDVSDTFYGIYYTHEMYGNMAGYEKYWGEMLGTIRDFVYEQDPSLQFMASLYCSDHHMFDDSGGKTIEGKMQKFVSDLLTNKGKAILKSGDMIAVQDKLATHPKTGVEYNAKFLYAVRNALKALAANDDSALNYWIIVENFNPDLTPAPIERYILQLLICSQLTDDLILFSYSLYSMPKDELNRPIKEGM